MCAQWGITDIIHFFVSQIIQIEIKDNKKPPSGGFLLDNPMSTSQLTRPTISKTYVFSKLIVLVLNSPKLNVYIFA